MDKLSTMELYRLRTAILSDQEQMAQNPTLARECDLDEIILDKLDSELQSR